MDDKKKVVSFEELKKKAEEKPTENKSIGNDIKNADQVMGALENEDFKSFMESMGIQVDDVMNKQILEALNNKEVMNLLNNLDINDLNPSSINKLATEMKSMEEKYKKEQMSFRAFGQWQKFYKPYRFENLYPVELLRGIAEDMKISYGQHDSKNDLISKINQSLVQYLTKTFGMMSRDIMGIIGKIVYFEGEMESNTLLSEKEELVIDFLLSKCLIARTSSNGNHYFVIPKDIMEKIDQIDFVKIDRYNELNQNIIKTVIGLVNSYGIVSVDLIKENLYDYFGEKINNLFTKEEFDTHFANLCKFSFTESIVKRGLYPNVVIDGEYIHHAVVGFTQNLIDIQNESIKEYKKYDLNEIQRRGDSFFYEDSLYISKIIDEIKSLNNISSQDAEDLKNLIFTFAKLEFEPSLIMRMIEMNYVLPEKHKYEMFLEVIRDFYKNSEKWILKGFTPYETNHNSSNNDKYDASKIVNIDFTKK